VLFGSRERVRDIQSGLGHRRLAARNRRACVPVPFRTDRPPAFGERSRFTHALPLAEASRARYEARSAPLPFRGRRRPSGPSKPRARGGSTASDESLSPEERRALVTLIDPVSRADRSPLTP
jgi:hypothetical protein